MLREEDSRDSAAPVRSSMPSAPAPSEAGSRANSVAITAIGTEHDVHFRAEDTDSEYLPQEDFDLTTSFCVDEGLRARRPLVHFVLSRWHSMTSMLEAFGPLVVFALTIVYALLKGIGSQTLITLYLPLYKDAFCVKDSAAFQQYSNAAAMAWSMKPIFGLISDNFPIRGYRKRWYLVASSICCVLCLGTVFVTPAGHPWSVILVTMALFVANANLATLDLLCEGVYSRLIVLRPKAGTAVVAWVWGLVMGSGAVSAVLVGPFADAGESRMTMLVLIPIIIVGAIPLVMNWLGERPIIGDPKQLRMRSTRVTWHEQEGGEAADAAAAERRDEQSGAQRPTTEAEALYDDEYARTSKRRSVLRVAAKSWHSALVDKILPCLSPRLTADPLRRQISMLGVVMGILAPLSAVVSMLTAESDGIVAFAFAASCAGTVSALGFLWLPRVAARANLYVFLKEALYVSCTGALGYWYTADSECVPNGPHFSYTYYGTVANVVSSLAGALGAIMFQRFLGHGNYRTVFYITTVLRIIASGFDVMLVTRANLSIGIPDHYAYIFGDAIIYQMSYVLDFMPAVMLTASLCPHGLESTMYALLAGFGNFGQIVSQSLGSVLTSAFGIVTEDGRCDFRNLAPLVVLAHAALPLLLIGLIGILLPDKRIGESLTEPTPPQSPQQSPQASRRSTVVPTEAQQSEQALLIEFRSDLDPPDPSSVPARRPGISLMTGSS